MKKDVRVGFYVIELLVVIDDNRSHDCVAVASVQQAREAARRTQCRTI